MTICRFVSSERSTYSSVSRCVCHGAFFSADADSQARFEALAAFATSGLAWAKAADGVSSRAVRIVSVGFIIGEFVVQLLAGERVADEF